MNRLAAKFLGASAFLIAGAGAAFAQPFAAAVDTSIPESIEIGISSNEIAITPDFSGADITVFGALTGTDELLQEIGQYDIVVTLEGPKTDTIVRRKERVLGVWINTQSLTFADVPISYSFASTRVIDSIAAPLSLNKLALGIGHIPLQPKQFQGGIRDFASFRNALRRQKISSGLYQDNPGDIRFVSKNLFKASLRLPANIPNGTHTVHAYLFKSGVFLSEKFLPLRVVKTGIEQSLTYAAYSRSYFYGVFAVLLALLTGWVASVIFRKE